MRFKLNLRYKKEKTKMIDQVKSYEFLNLWNDKSE